MSAAANAGKWARSTAVPHLRADPGRVARLNYALSGGVREQAVLFLHGFMGSSEDWREVAAELAGRFRCLAVDLPGHGKSVGLSPEDYTFEGAARILLALLDTLAVGRPSFVGYSMGGRLALYLALRHPERCSKLFLESASPGIEDAAEREARRRADEKRAARLETGNFREFVEDWYRQPLFASLARRAGLLERTVEARRRNDPGELARSLRGMGIGSQPSLWRVLAALRVPVLAVAGELDGKFVSIANRMAAASPGVRATVVPGAGHNVRAEVPEVYLALLRRYLSAAP